MSEPTTSLVTEPAPAGAPESAAQPADTGAVSAAPTGEEGGTLLTDAAPAADATDGGDPSSGDADPKPGDDGQDQALEGAPDEYEDFAAPEGVVFDPEVSGELKSLAKEFNLSQANAQRLADLGGKLVEKWVDGFADALVAQRQGWRESAQAEFNGEQLATAKRALETYGTPELTKFLNEEGVGNHPEIIRLLARVGETVSEDGFVAGGKAKPKADQPLANRLYPNLA